MWVRSQTTSHTQSTSGTKNTLDCFPHGTPRAHAIESLSFLFLLVMLCHKQVSSHAGTTTVSDSDVTLETDFCECLKRHFPLPILSSSVAAIERTLDRNIPIWGWTEFVKEAEVRCINKFPLFWDFSWVSTSVVYGPIHRSYSNNKQARECTW